MWKNFFDAFLKSYAHDDPQTIDHLAVMDGNFAGWSKFFNPYDLGNLDKEEKVVVKMVSEDIAELKMRAAYYHYLIKKTQDLKFRVLYGVLHDLANEQFWVAIRFKYKLWSQNIGLRDGWQIVVPPDNHDQVPDFLRKLLGG